MSRAIVAVATSDRGDKPREFPTCLDRVFPKAPADLRDTPAYCRTGYRGSYDTEVNDAAVELIAMCRDLVLDFCE